MPAGMTRPFGHQGLVDGDESGGVTPPPTPGFLSTIYAAGLADDPAVDNLMTGPLQRFFVNLGSTPPPFPPNAQPFFPESALFVGEFPGDSGVGADSKPLWRMQRHFTTFPSDGEQIWFETQYDLFGSGINSITGGDRQLHWLIDQFDNRLAFAGERFHLSRPGLFAPGYTPLYLDNSPVTYVSWEMMDALGSGNTNVWTFNSDGAQFRRVFIPNAIGGGGGSPGPWNYIANGMAMWSRNGGEPLVGSRLYYDAVTAQTFGDIDDSLGQLMVAHAVVLDAKNLGSGQAAGHGEIWARSTLGGALTLAGEFFDVGFVFPKGFVSSDDDVFNGTTDTFNSTVVFAGGLQANVTAFLNAGANVTGGIATDSFQASTAFSVFGATGGGQQTMGAAVAGGTYGATEQAMLQTVYDVVRFFGFGT